MAVKPNDNDAFLREVDEELRREQVGTFFKRYGRLIIGAVVLILALAGGYLWWQQHRQEVAGEQAQALDNALQALDAHGRNADGQFAPLAGSSQPGYRAAALFGRADVALQSGHTAQAVATLRAIAADQDIAQPYRDAAVIRQTLIEYDHLADADVIRRLSPYARPGNPWFGTAGELTAIAYLRAGQTQRAATLLAAIARDTNVPQTIRDRSGQMAASLGADVPLPEVAAADPTPQAAPAAAPATASAATTNSTAGAVGATANGTSTRESHR